MPVYSALPPLDSIFTLTAAATTPVSAFIAHLQPLATALSPLSSLTLTTTDADIASVQSDVDAFVNLQTDVANAVTGVAGVQSTLNRISTDLSAGNAFLTSVGPFTAPGGSFSKFNSALAKLVSFGGSVSDFLTSPAVTTFFRILDVVEGDVVAEINFAIDVLLKYVNIVNDELNAVAGVIQTVKDEVDVVRDGFLSAVRDSGARVDRRGGIGGRG